MKNALEKQESHLAKLVDLSKQDMLLQLSQSAFQRQTDLDVRKNDKDTSEHLDEINDTLKKGLTDKQSNMRGVFDELKKQSKTLEKMSPERAKEITDKAMGTDQFKTIGERVDEFKEGFKSLFTLKGFLNKTGLVNENSGGIVSTAINRRAARKQYIEDRVKVDPQQINQQAGKLAQKDGVDYKTLSEDEKQQYRSKAEQNLRKTYGDQFDQQQTVRRDMRKNEAEISRLQRAGFNEGQLQRTGLLDKRGELAAKLEKVDTRVKVAKATPEGGAKAVPADSFSDEAALENQRSQAQVVDLLAKIEENTRPVTGDVPKETKKEVGGNSIFGGILESSLGFLKTGLLNALKFIFNPRNILKFVTKIFVPAMIIGSIVNGVVDAFKAFFNGGSFVDVLVAGLGGVLEFLTFGLLDAQSIKNAAEWMGNMVDEYIIQPIMQVGTKLFGLLDEYVLEPLANLFKPVTDFFRKIKDQVIGFFENFGIPEIGFTIPIINKKVSIGPFYPFKSDEASSQSSNSISAPSNSASGNSSTLTQTPSGNTSKTSVPGSTTAGEIAKEDEAYQKLGFVDKLKVDAGFAKASELLEAKKPEVKSGTAVYDKSAQNAEASMDAQKSSAPVIVNAPTNVSNTSKQNIAMPAPVRNQDSGFNRYLNKTVSVI